MNPHSRRLYPPISALHAFVAAAQQGSFSRAAADIGLTQSAVSRQIATLEDWLQRPLFERRGRRILLTEFGRSYADAITPSLAAIRVATANAIAAPDEATLRIATLPSFGMRWLAPRLGLLSHVMPDIVIDFAARSQEFDFNTEPFDAAVHYGLPTWNGAHHEFLFRERAIPVVSPKLLQDRTLDTPLDILSFPLLTQNLRKTAWRKWFAALGHDQVGLTLGPTFEHFLMMAQAAAGGAGFALLPSYLIEPELASGALVCPFDLSVAESEAYYLVFPKDRPRNTALNRFQKWILIESQSLRDARHAGENEAIPS